MHFLTNKSGFQCFALLVFLSFTPAWTQAQNCDSLMGQWINPDGSVLHILDESQEFFSGYYQSNASGDANKFEFVGVVNRKGKLPTLSFQVNWQDYGSITSWTGYCKEEEHGPVITTMWHLVRPYVEDDWERFVTNTSTFRPKP